MSVGTINITTICTAACFTLTLNQKQDIKLLPLTVSSETPFSCKSGDRSTNFKIFLCETRIYEGCTMTVDFNNPDDPWDYRAGNFFDYVVLSGDNTCSQILCQNDYKAAISPNICSFKYTQSLGNNLYIRSTCGSISSITATMNMRIDCNKKIPDNYTKNNLGCPSNYFGTKQTIVLETNDVVPTSKNLSKANYYTFTACGDPNKKQQVTISITGVGGDSAMSTYVCDKEDCYVSNSPSGWFDDSGTLFNFIQINNLTPKQLWFFVMGRGLYEHSNNYTLGIDTTSYN